MQRPYHRYGGRDSPQTAASAFASGRVLVPADPTAPLPSLGRLPPRRALECAAWRTRAVRWWRCHRPALAQFGHGLRGWAMRRHGLDPACADLNAGWASHRIGIGMRQAGVTSRCGPRQPLHCLRDHDDRPTPQVTSSGQLPGSATGFGAIEALTHRGAEIRFMSLPRCPDSLDCLPPWCHGAPTLLGASGLGRLELDVDGDEPRYADVLP